MNFKVIFPFHAGKSKSLHCKGGIERNLNILRLEPTPQELKNGAPRTSHCLLKYQMFLQKGN